MTVGAQNDRSSGTGLSGLEHGSAESVGAGAGEKEEAGVANLLEGHGEVLSLRGFLTEIHIDPQLKPHGRLGIRHDSPEFINETTCQT